MNDVYYFIITILTMNGGLKLITNFLTKEKSYFLKYK